MDTQSAEDTGGGVSLEQEEEEAEVWEKWFEAEILTVISKELLNANEELNKELILKRKLRKIDLELKHVVASSEVMEHDLKSELAKAESRADNAEHECNELSQSNALLEKDKDFLKKRMGYMDKMLSQVEESKMAKVIGESTKVLDNLVTQLAVEGERLNNQLSSLASDNKILVAKLKQTYKDPSQESYCDFGH